MEQERDSWLANQPMMRKVMLALGIVMVCFATASAFTMRTFHRETLLNAREAQHYGLIEELAKSIDSMRLQQVAVRDILISGDGDEDEIAKMHSARDQRDQAIARAAGHAEGISSDIKGNLGEVGRLALRYDDEVGRIVARHRVDADANEGDRQSAANTDYVNLLQPIAAETIGRMLTIRDEMHRTLRGERERMDADVRAARALTLAMLVVGALISFWSLWFSHRLVVAPIRRLTELMTRLAADDHTIDIPMRGRRDEIGAIARSLEVFRHNTVVSHERGWVKANVAEVGALAQQADTVADYAAMLATEIGTRLGAGVGMFYAWDAQDGELALSGNYGYRERKHLATRYRLGEGLVGECARGRKVIVLEPVPQDYIRIHSGTGEGTPRCIILLPLLLRHQLLGVLEFGSFGRFSETQQAFLDEVLPLLALGLDNQRRAEDTLALLETTRRQADVLAESEEAMRVQQEELRSSNEELHAKTAALEEHAQRLLSSEEELRVQAEELQASNEELRQQGEILNEQKVTLERLQRETQVKAEQLARSSQYKSDFLANMSHELRTPLNSLLILSQGLADNESGHLDPGEVEAAQVIHDSGSNLLRLINDILDLSKIEAGKMELIDEDILVEAIASSMLRQFRPIAAAKGVDLSVRHAGEFAGTLRSDGAKLQQILTNLLGNACKFTREGQVELVIGPASTDQLAGTELDGTSALAFVVSDTGIGIPPERLEHVFDAFEQVDSSTSRHYGGSGLGLSIARRLAGLLGGQLIADSRIDAGSTFTLLLPLQRGVTSPVGAVDAGIAMASASGTRVRERMARPVANWSIDDDRDCIEPGETVILTIEDDPAFARILVDMIRRKGHRALSAGDGETGLELVRRLRPTAVLLDIMLPGMDGWAVLERIKSDPLTRHIPVHMVSAVDDPDRGRQLGAVGMLTKPVQRQALTAAFDHLLAAAERSSRHVLLVDDDVDSRIAIDHLLRSDVVRIDEADSGEMGLRMLGERRYDCIVLDLGLGDITGLEFLERASQGGPLPPVVIYSARDLSSDESLKLRHYTDSIVIKGSRSTERLLDEVSLFLHRIKSGGVSAAAVDGNLQGRRVLIVDDDMRNIFALSRTLRAKGVDVLMAQDGHKALRQLGEHPDIELVLMDIMMPGIDGYETIREIRSTLGLKRLPIIAITAKAMQGDRDRCIEAGANDYLAKPIDVDRLMSMMHVWLQQ